MTLALAIPEAQPPVDRGGWAARVRLVWGAALEAVLAAGRVLIEARAALPVGEFSAMVEAELPFSRPTAYKLIAIAEDQRLVGDAHVHQLPPHWGTLYELSKLDDGTLDHAFTKGLIRPDMERKDAERLRTGQRRGERLARSEQLSKTSPPPESMLASGRRYPVVYADPPTRFEVWSERGLEKAAENHYPTMPFDELAALPVDALAARDAALFVWSTGPWLWLTLQLIQRWGFVYKAQACWPKRNADGSLHRGHGYWFIDCHELLLVGTRGDIPAPLMGTQELSLIEAELGRHSEKPARFRDVIDRYFPGVGKIELFAGDAAAVPGWDRWGNPHRESAE